MSGGEKAPPADPIAEMRKRFEVETAEHKLTVLRDDGLYRHLRFQKPESSFYWFDLITWPGVLTVSGDCGCFVFSRTRDMFPWFEGAHGGINPHYWAQKLRAPESRGARQYSYDCYRQHVEEWYANRAEEMDEAEAAALRQAVDEDLLSDWSDAVHDESAAHMALRDFEHNGVTTGDSWEWDLREYRWEFLWCCWAIVWGIEEYRAAVAPKAQPGGADNA